MAVAGRLARLVQDPREPQGFEYRKIDRYAVGGAETGSPLFEPEALSRGEAERLGHQRE